jgi:hypothetical protein
MRNVTFEIASKNRMAYIYRPDVGYREVGLLPMPTEIKGSPEQCEPLAVAADGSLHFLNPPKGASPMLMRWHPKEREWSGMNIAVGHRMGFTSAYLAAHEWRYAAPAQAG